MRWAARRQSHHQQHRIPAPESENDYPPNLPRHQHPRGCRRSPRRSNPPRPTSRPRTSRVPTRRHLPGHRRAQADDCRRQADHDRGAPRTHRQRRRASCARTASTRSCSRAERRCNTSRASAGAERADARAHSPVKGTPFIVCPKFEEERAMEQVRTGPLDKGTEVHTLGGGR